jgi:hypothetical protein
MEDESTQPDPLRMQADRLEKALSENERRKKEAADLALKNAPQLERLRSLQEKLNSLPQNERRALLDKIGLVNVSAAPRPLEAIRSSGPMPRLQKPETAPEPALRGGVVASSPPTGKKSPRWAFWRQLPSLELWQAVALSLGKEPEAALEDEACGSAPVRPHIFSRLPTEFFDRLSDCRRGLSTAGPIHPQGPLYRGMLNSPSCRVLLAEVAAFLRVAEYAMPEEMTPEPSAVPEPGNGLEKPQERQARRLHRLRELGDDMKRVGESWQTERRSGAMATLEREEAAAGRPMSDKTDIRKDLAAAAVREYAIRAAGGTPGD